jgi:hypothetical protein
MARQVRHQDVDEVGIEQKGLHTHDGYSQYDYSVPRGCGTIAAANRK